MKQNIRRFSALIALAVVLALVSSVVFIAVEADHACIGGDCRICCQILNQISLLKNTAAGGMVLCLVLAAVTPAGYIRYTEHGLWSAVTLVSHKVKLSI